MSLTFTANRYASRVHWASITIIIVSLLLVALSLPFGRAIEVLRRSIDGLGFLVPIVGLLATLAVTVYVTSLVKRRLADQPDLDETAAAPAGESIDEAPRGWPWGATVASVLAVVMAAGAVWAQLNPTVVAGLFGPPQAELAEAYEETTGTASFDHGAFDRLLSTHVDGAGWVDYEGLASEAAVLDLYIEALGSAPFEELGRDDKLALLINAYNAFTLRLILDYYPLDSIKDIPSAKRWDDPRWLLAGNLWSLNQIEHEQVRPNFAEPRIHFALVCAAAGCPPLRSEVYTGEQIEEQLHGQSVYVHTHERWFRAEGEAIHLTQLYDWYGGDFEQVAGSVLEFVARYSPTVKQGLAAGESPSVHWIDYDWSLNIQR